jgi:uncharacterized protein
VYSERFYRRGMGSSRFEPVTIKAGESDLWIGIPPGSDSKAIEAAARSRLLGLRAEIAEYASLHPDFYSSLEPLPEDARAVGIAASMLGASRAAGVGPMAAVAGAVAGALGEYLSAEFALPELVIENGGDDYLRIASPITVSIYSGLSGLSGKIGVEVPPELSPLGICTSSARVGPSLSFGNADACLVACADCALADAYATAFGNRVRGTADIEPCLRDALTIPGVLSLVIVRGATCGAIGRLRLGPLRNIA